MNYVIPIVAASALVLAGCATAPENIQASYVNPNAYRGMTCSQLNADAVRINNRLQAATGRQTQAAGNDAAMTAVALVLFWPALFAVQGDRGGEAEIAQLRGEAIAVAEAAQARGC